MACAVALETLSIYRERRLLDHVRARAPQFQDRLQGLAGHPLVGEVRGIGLLGAAELVRDKATRAPFEVTDRVGNFAADAAQDEGILLRAMGDSLALCPPLVISEAEIDELFAKLLRALDRTHQELARRGLVA